MGVQVKTGHNVRRVGAGTYSRKTTIDVEVVDHLRDEELCLLEYGGSDVSGRVYDEDDVDRKLGRWSWTQTISAKHST